MAPWTVSATSWAPCRADGGAVVEAPALDRHARVDLLEDERVEHRLQRLSAADDHPVLRADLARLVVGGALHARRVALDQIDGPPELDPAIELHRRVLARRIALTALLETETEGQLEEGRLPRRIERRAAQPFAQIRADAGHAVLPHALDRRRQPVLVLRDDVRQDLIQVGLRKGLVALGHR